MADGSVCSGFIAEAIAMDGARDISDYGGWRGYCASKE
jgi:allophanate hydrolase